jgi:hypothetical protein
LRAQKEKAKTEEETLKQKLKLLEHTVEMYKERQDHGPQVSQWPFYDAINFFLGRIEEIVIIIGQISHVRNEIAQTH